ncbi:MAG: choice-of-anchor D domain-containing protein, partial [Caldimonas sp.]
SVSFGNVQIGVPKLFATPVVVSNVGSAPLTFSVAAPPNSAAALSGPNKTDFSVTGNCLAASPLAAVVPPATVGGTCNLNITFTPGAISPPLRTATLTINSDATNGPLLIALDGNGVALPEPIVTFPGSNFPDTVIGETAALTRQVTIHNDRTRDITYSVANITDFTIGTESCPGRVVTGGGGDCTVNIQFAPTLGSGEGPRVGTLTFTFAGTGGDIAPSNATGNVGGNALLPLGPPTSTLNAAAVVGTPTTVSELLTNRAATPLTLTSLVLGGTNPGDYAFDATNTCTNGRVLAASSSCMLVVRFAPVTAGARNATISITHTAPGSPQTVTLLGTATPAPQGRIVVGATSPLVFPDTQLGSTFPQSFIVQNTGNLALTFSAFTISGAAAADYLRGGDGSVAAPLPIGGQCTLTLTFQPTALGLRSASIVITSDASNGAASLVLNGTGIPVPVPVVSLTPPALDFGVQTTGGIYPSRRLHLANVGTANLIIASVAVEGTGFANASATPCPAVLAPGAACDIDVAFMATAAIPYSGDVRVTSNAAGSPNLSTLSGSGSAAAVAVLIWSPAVTTIDFGTVVAGSVSAVQSVTVLNQGPGGVNLTVLNAVGFDSASFSVVGGTCQIGVPLFQGDSCRVDVQFSPGSSGPKTAQVQIASTGSFPTTLTLTGIGLAGPNPNLAVSATSMAFGTTTVGAQSVPATIRLTSSGSGVVRVSAVGVTGAYVVQSTTCPAVPFSLPAGSECTISVSFRPTAEGVANGVLSITTDAVPSERDVALTGTGQAEADVSSGGCSISSGRSLLDPTLWLLALLAVVALAYRRRQRQHARERK